MPLQRRPQGKRHDVRPIDSEKARRIQIKIARLGQVVSRNIFVEAHRHKKNPRLILDSLRKQVGGNPRAQVILNEIERIIEE